MNRLAWNGIISGTMLGMGALTMYFLDPDRGRRRRVMFADTLAHSGYESRKFAGRFRRDLQHRAEGTIAEAKSLFNREPSPDEVLKERVRSILGRVVARPQSVQVKSKEGRVELSGKVVADEAEHIRRAVESVRGVRDVSVALETAEGPEQLPKTVKKSEEIAGFFGDKWSPTARVIVGGAGVALMADGIRRHRSPLSKAAFGGCLMLARSIFNMPLRRVPLAGIHVEKTIHVHARRDDLFAFWSKPENYAKLFSHVKEVHPEGDGIYRWHVMGPAGIPFSWTGKITKLIPGKRVEWESLPGSAVENRGVIHLDDEANGYTRVHVQLKYAPPAGLVGHGLATLLGIDPRKAMHHDFVQMQSLLERGFTTAHAHRVTSSELGISEPVSTGA